MLPDEKKKRVPWCRINENLFIIDFTPTEDAANNRFGLNSEKKNLRADNHSCFLTFDPEVIQALPGANYKKSCNFFGGFLHLLCQFRRLLFLKQQN